MLNNKYIKILFSLTLFFWILFTLYFIKSFIVFLLPPDCRCVLEFPLQSDMVFTQMESGKSYPIKNILHPEIGPLSVYMYTEKEKINRKSDLKIVKNNCNMPDIIGEIHHRNFSYSHRVNNYYLDLFLGSDGNVYGLDFYPKTHCKIGR